MKELADGALLVLNDGKKQYFERYIVNRGGRTVKNTRLCCVNTSRKHEVRVKASDDLLSARYIAKPNNRVEVYAYDSVDKLYIKNTGKKPMFIRYNGIELVVMPNKCQALMREKPEIAV